MSFLLLLIPFVKGCMRKKMKKVVFLVRNGNERACGRLQRILGPANPRTTTPQVPEGELAPPQVIAWTASLLQIITLPWRTLAE